ncbi:TPA: helix-turn-helix domain-containing protein [Vibrio harveyi]
MQKSESNSSVKLEIICWLETCLKEKGTTKSDLAKYVGVSKQSVTRWFSKGLISKENLITAAKYFNAEPPLDLLSLTPSSNKNPLAYEWTPSARLLVSLLMEDQKTPAGRAKIDALVKIYDLVNSHTE